MDAPHHSRFRRAALCLSGGGYRAAAFHTGTLWRLNELGWLKRLDAISAVSGGALAAGRLALTWSELNFINGVATDFEEFMAQPLQKLMDMNIAWPAGLLGLLPGRTGNGELARYFRDFLFGDADMGQLPENPDFVFCATDLRHGSLWTFDRRRMGNAATGWFDPSAMSLAAAVAASSAFPPYFAPARFPLNEDGWLNANMAEAPPPYHGAILGDGGEYDDLALDTAFKNFATVLISDASEELEVQSAPSSNWLCQIIRASQIMAGQARLQRLDRARAAFRQASPAGAIFGLTGGLPSGYKIPNGFDPAVVPRLCKLPTKYVRLDRRTQEQLINWGYVICDAMMEKISAPTPPAASLPYPG